ncbi:hypothetical protein D3C73_1194700 [compost metagenome]
MTKTVYRTFWFTEESVAYRKVNTGRAQRKHRLTSIHHTDANRACRVISATRNHRDLGHAPGLRDRRQQRAGNLAAFKQRRHMRTGQVTGCQHDVAPVALRNVQPHRTGGIRHITGEFPGHTQTQVIFRQQDFINLAENLRFMALNPQQFGCRKTRHHQIASDAARLWNLVFQYLALLCAASVIP